MEKNNQKDFDYTYTKIFLGHKVDKYLDVFKKINSGNIIVPSNEAGLFGISWLIYRKASFYGLLAYIVMVIIGYSVLKDVSALSISEKIMAIIVATHVFFFFFGNFIYWYSVKTKIDSFISKYGKTSAITYLSEKGGVLTGFGLVCSVIVFKGTVLLFLYLSLNIKNLFDILAQSISSLAG